MGYTGGHGPIYCASLIQNENNNNKKAYAHKITKRLARRTYDWQKQIHSIKTMVIQKEEDSASTYI